MPYPVTPTPTHSRAARPSIAAPTAIVAIVAAANTIGYRSFVSILRPCERWWLWCQAHPRPCMTQRWTAATAGSMATSAEAAMRTRITRPRRGGRGRSSVAPGEHPQEPSAVVALDDQARCVGGHGVRHHGADEPCRIPEGEQWGHEGNGPVHDLGSAGLGGEARQVRRVARRQGPLRGPAPEHGAELRQTVLPSPDAEPLVHPATTLPRPQPREGASWSRRRNGSRWAA